jgi:hypothetical protein
VVVGVIALLVRVLGKLGLQLTHLLLKIDNIGSVNLLALGAVVVLARRAGSFAGDTSRKGWVAPRFPLDRHGCQMADSSDVAAAETQQLTWRHLQHAVRVWATRWGASCTSCSGLSHGYGPGTGGLPTKKCCGGSTEPRDWWKTAAGSIDAAASPVRSQEPKPQGCSRLPTAVI